jgi:DNA replication protein DnaC
MTPFQALNVLAAHYSLEVQRRHGNPVFDANTEANLLALARYLTQPDPRFGVMMCGTCGNGKTTLLYALQSALNYLNQMGHFTFLSEYFQVGMEIVDAKDIVIMAKDLKAIRNLRSRSMLAIDDLGKEAAEVLDFGNALSPVIDLLEYRYQHQLFTAITTNLTNEEITKKYGKRIADRFNEMLEVIIFQDITYRH